MRYLKISILISALLFMFQNSVAQSFSNVSDVISSSGGESSGGSYTNFGVLAETFVNLNVIGGNYVTCIGFLQTVDTITCVGISNLDRDHRLSLFPNPTDGIIKIESSFEVSEVTIYTILGEIVFNQQNVNKVNLVHLLPGTYIARIKDKDGKFLVVKRLIKR